MVWSIEIMDDTQFYENFRLTRNQFEILLEKVINQQPIKKARFKLLLFMYFISERTTYNRIKEKFGCAKSTSHRYIEKVSKIFCENYKRSLFPSSDEFEELQTAF